MSKADNIINIIRDWDREWELHMIRDTQRPINSSQLSEVINKLFFPEAILEIDGMKMKVVSEVIDFLEMGEVEYNEDGDKFYLIGDKKYKFISNQIDNVNKSKIEEGDE